MNLRRKTLLLPHIFVLGTSLLGGVHAASSQGEERTWVRNLRPSQFPFVNGPDGLPRGKVWVVEMRFANGAILKSSSIPFHFPTPSNTLAMMQVTPNAFQPPYVFFTDPAWVRGISIRGNMDCVDSRTGIKYFCGMLVVHTKDHLPAQFCPEDGARDFYGNPYCYYGGKEQCFFQLYSVRPEGDPPPESLRRVYAADWLYQIPVECPVAILFFDHTTQREWWVP